MFKKYLMAGLLFWVPTVVTVVCIRILLDAVESVFNYLPSKLQPEFWIGTHIPGIELALLLCVVFITGILVANFLGRKAVGKVEELLEKIPLIRSIYSGVKQVMQIMIKPKSRAFQEVALISFPQEGSWAIGLVTQVDERDKKEEDALTVFVPTTPNPTSGYVVIVFRKDAIILDMTVDEALKYIISLGTLSHDALKRVYGKLAGENKK